MQTTTSIGEDVAALTATTFRTMFGIELAPAPAAPAVGAPVPRATPTWTGIVQITGAYEGAVILVVDVAMATRIAAAMFEMDAATVGDDERRDALGELANVVGGNIKARLRQPAQLSLPTVANGTSYTVLVRGTHVVTAARFVHGASIVEATLSERSRLTT